MTSRIEDYALIGDTQTAALVGRRRLDRLAVRAPLRLRRRASPRCSATRDNGRWLLAPRGRACQPVARRTATTRSCSRPSSTPPTARSASSTACRSAAGRVDIVRIVEGLRGRVPMRMELVVRFDYGVDRPVGRRHRATARPRRRRARTRCASRTPVRTHGARLRHVADFTVARGRAGAVRRSPCYPSHEPPPRADRRRTRAIERDRAVVAAVVARSRTYDGEWREAVHALAHHAEGADLRADRRDRGRAHDVAARADRRRAQLGLPLLLAARRDVHALLAHDRAATTTRRARGATGCCAPSPAIPQHLQIMYGAAGERRLTEYELDWLARLRGLAPGADRQRRAASSSSSTCTARSSTRCYQTRRAGIDATDADAWALQRALLDFLERHWQRARRGHLGGARARGSTSPTRR